MPLRYPNPLPVANGGTGLATLTAHSVQLGNGTGTVTQLAVNSSATKVLTSGGSSADPSWADVTASSFGTQTAGTFLAGPTSGSAATPTFRALQVMTKQQFTSGSGTYTTPSGVLYLKVTVVGAGGGGSTSGTAGSTAATDGGASYWRTTGDADIIQAPGGSKGVFGSATGGTGGVAPTISSGATDISSRPGTSGGGALYNGASANQPGGSPGGGNAYCGPGVPGAGAGAAAPGATTAGQGGSGGGCDNVNNSFGGTGGGGGAYAYAYVSAPSASYHYVVGAAGSGGAQGTSGHAGGSGGAGIIIVEEYYQ